MAFISFNGKYWNCQSSLNPLFFCIGFSCVSHWFLLFILTDILFSLKWFSVKYPQLFSPGGRLNVPVCIYLKCKRCVGNFDSMFLLNKWISRCFSPQLFFTRLWNFDLKIFHCIHRSVYVCVFQLLFSVFFYSLVDSWASIDHSPIIYVQDCWSGARKKMGTK